MGEIDTKPIDSVQAALSFFGQRSTEQRRYSPVRDDSQEVERERELESLTKDLASTKLQLEAKDSAYKQVLLKLDHHIKTADDLSTLLQKSDAKKQFYINEFREANSRISELDSTMKLMTDQLKDSERDKEQLESVTSDLVSKKEKLVEIESELANMRDEKFESVLKTKAMETALGEERRKANELQVCVSEMNETIEFLKMKVFEVESEKSDTILEKEDKLELAIKALYEAQEQLQCMKHQMETTQLELNNKKEFYESEISILNENLENMKAEMEKNIEKENDVQVEIALLKFELHKGRSKLALAEATEARLQGEKSALYNALQQMGLEAQESQKENRELKEAMKLYDMKIESQDKEYEEVENEIQVHQSNDQELEKMKKELEIANAKIGEFRTRAEQAITRAESAEKVKAVLEEKMKRRKDHSEKRKAALAALCEESVPKEFSPTSNIRYEYDTSSKNYQPLGKVLNMKFK